MTDQTKKQNKGKPPVYQGCLAYFPRALLAVAEVSEFGRQKYGADWTTKGWLDVSRGDLMDADARHMLKEVIEGPVNHEDGSLLHAAQHAWEALAALEVMLVERETVDPAADQE